MRNKKKTMNETKSKKKIGCVIAYSVGHNNYGTSLQGYAMLKKFSNWDMKSK